MKRSPLITSIFNISIIALALSFLYFYNSYLQQQKLVRYTQDRQQQIIDAKKNIIFNTIPKSGSAYIRQTLAKSIGYKNVNLASGYFPNDTIIYDDINDFYLQRNLLTQDHLDPSAVNIQVLNLFTDRMVVHVRDPRQVLLSWTHYTNDLNTQTEKHNLHHIVPYPPPEYFSWSLNQQIDWNIEHHLENLVSWMQGWVAYKQQQDLTPHGFKILFTTYDEFKQDEVSFYYKILDFYAIPREQFQFKATSKDTNVHFRKGDVNEWKTVFTPQQKAKIAQIVPQDLLQYFGWE